MRFGSQNESKRKGRHNEKHRKRLTKHKKNGLENSESYLGNFRKERDTKGTTKTGRNYKVP